MAKCPIFIYSLFGKQQGEHIRPSSVCSHILPVPAVFRVPLQPIQEVKPLLAQRAVVVYHPMVLFCLVLPLRLHPLVLFSTVAALELLLCKWETIPMLDCKMISFSKIPQASPSSSPSFNSQVAGQVVPLGVAPPPPPPGVHPRGSGSTILYDLMLMKPLPFLSSPHLSSHTLVLK